MAATEKSETALIVGAGPGLSTTMARLFAKSGMKIGLASRSPDKLAGLAGEIGAKTYRCDVSRPDEVAKLFDDAVADLGIPDLVVFNPNALLTGAITELDPAKVLNALTIVTFGGFLVAQQAARHMVPRGTGSIMFTGNGSSLRGRPRAASNAMAKFGLRGLAQALARELQPQGIHVAHIVADSGIAAGIPNDPRAKGPDSLVDPEHLAETFLQLHRQHRSTWACEIDVRPWSMAF